MVDVPLAGVDEEPTFEVEDCAAAVENMLLATTALGYATVWVDGWLRYENHALTVCLMLGVPAQKTIRVILPIGVPLEIHQQKQKLPFEARAWFNRYGG
ncbi:MAG: nitroreductase family protein [Candidatus Hydrogenedentes bacterium]|nr:nitroreductase family protein [Candidatus Hydrogenedentota bacterium]